jgi:hypothetical protein
MDTKASDGENSGVSHNIVTRGESEDEWLDWYSFNGGNGGNGHVDSDGI